jgi:membrane fusion protein, heavy metal efflux system
MKGGKPSGNVLVWILAAIGLAGVVVAILASTIQRPAKVGASSVDPPARSLRLMPGSANTLELSAQLINTLGVRTMQVQSAASHDRLTLSGSLSFDSNRMVPVHSRFPGEVISIGTYQSLESGPGKGEARLLRVGDHVTKGQLLAVIWSKEVGEKKSDLVNALSSRYLHQAQLSKIMGLDNDVIPGKQIREAERDLEQDIIEVDRLERTLRSWRLPEAEINLVRAEAEKIHRGDVASDMEVDRSWAEVEIRCPFDGTVLEKNIVPGSMVSDTSLDLFKIADLSVLAVMANVYEEDLPALDSLKPEDQRWTISLKSQSNAPGIPGKFDRIGNIVDPNQHTAAIMGWLDNRDGRLRAGQFITAIVELPAAAGEVVIPDTALVQDGPQCLVFVANNASGSEVTRRRVDLVSRGQDVAYIRIQPHPEERAKGCEALKPGEWVVTAGSIELDGALENALATTPQRESVQN